MSFNMAKRKADENWRLVAENRSSFLQQSAEVSLEPPEADKSAWCHDEIGHLWGWGSDEREWGSTFLNTAVEEEQPNMTTNVI
ncbi:MAG TPA: hypothetical protein VKR06_38075 [Ktedonosporobacter sp.]|nr:hypothetical protein [Ktedonosporobacter sp.]